VAIFTDHGLFAIAFSLHCSHHFSGGRIDGADVVRTVVIGENALGGGIVVDAIRPLADIDFLDELQGRGIEHGNFVLAPVAGEAVLEFRCNGGAVYARRIRNGAHHLAGVDIQDFYLVGVRDVQPPRGAVYC
jgi:hypothetical protein